MSENAMVAIIVCCIFASCTAQHVVDRVYTECPKAAVK